MPQVHDPREWNLAPLTSHSISSKIAGKDFSLDNILEHLAQVDSKGVNEYFRRRNTGVHAGQNGGVMYGWRARIGNISPTACAEILPYEFYRVAPEGVTFVSTNLVIRDARESSQVEASWQKFDTAFEDLLHTQVDHITLSGAPLVLANGVERHRELLQGFRKRYSVPVGTSPQSFADALKYLGAVKLAVATSFIPAHNELVKVFLASEGFDVLGIESLDTGMTSLEKALLSPTQVFRHVRGVGRKYSTCDAVLITSSAWPTLTVIQALEDDLGKPVVSSSMGQIWWPLKELGIKAHVKGYGKLLGTLS